MTGSKSSWFFEKNNKIGNNLPSLSKTEKGEDTKYQYQA